MTNNDHWCENCHEKITGKIYYFGFYEYCCPECVNKAEKEFIEYYRKEYGL